MRYGTFNNFFIRKHRISLLLEMYKLASWESPRGPMVRTQCFHCWGLGSIPGRGTKTLYVVWHGQKQTNKNPAKLARGSVSKRDLKGMV